MKVKKLLKKYNIPPSNDNINTEEIIESWWEDMSRSNGNLYLNFILKRNDILSYHWINLSSNKVITQSTLSDAISCVVNNIFTITKNHMSDRTKKIFVTERLSQ